MADHPDPKPGGPASSSRGSSPSAATGSSQTGKQTPKTSQARKMKPKTPGGRDAGPTNSTSQQRQPKPPFSIPMNPPGPPRIKPVRRNETGMISQVSRKHFYVDMVLHSICNSDADLCKEFVKKYAGNTMFHICRMRTDKSKKETCVSLSVETRADALHLARSLNREELWTSAHCRGFARDQELERFKTEMKQRKDGQLKAHAKKVKEQTTKLHKHNTDVSAMKNVPFHMEHKLRETRRTLQAKLDEMSKQEKEYTHSCDHLVAEIDEALSGLGIDETRFAEFKTEFAQESFNFSAALPIYACKTEIVNSVVRQRVNIVLGATGSGKSTQMVKYMIGKFPQGKIVCTQPRKLAALTLTERVAAEMGCRPGDTIGYRTGLHNKASKHTRVLFMTDHCLLNECLKDPLLKEYSVVIIDEAHERSLFTDLLLGMIKECLKQRPDLRVIVTSATIDPHVFARYFQEFGEVPIINVPGRTFPVEVKWLETPSDTKTNTFVESAVAQALAIHREESCGDILVFLTSPVDIERAIDLWEKLPKPKTSKSAVFPLHGKLQPADQRKVFEPTGDGSRKVIFSTNVAETSITIDGIRYVVDCGLAKEKTFDSSRNMSSLNVVFITQSSSDQRKGRAGRTAPGVCYRLYTSEEYESMRTTSPAEIFRVHLGQALLKLLQLGISDPLRFDFVESPSLEALGSAWQSLISLGAVCPSSLVITDFGRKIALLPFEPRLGKLVFLGIERGTPYEALVSATLISMGCNVFYRAGTDEEKAQWDKRKTKFCHEGGDVFTALTVFRLWEAVPKGGKGPWCAENSVNGKTMKGVNETIMEVLNTLKKDLKICIDMAYADEDAMLETLQRVLLETYQANLAVFSSSERVGYYIPRLGEYMTVHRSSSLFSLGLQPKWIIFDQILRTSRSFLTNVSALENGMIQELGSTLGLHLEDIESKIVQKKLVGGFGPKALAKLKGPRWSNLKALREKQLQEAVELDCVPVLEFQLHESKGMIEIHAFPTVMTSVQKEIINHLDNHRSTLLQRLSEVPVGMETHGIRLVLAAGGDVKEVLTADDFRSLRISFRECLEKDDVVSQLDMPNVVEVTDVRTRSRQQERSLIVQYTTSEHAREGKEGFNNIDGVTAKPAKTFVPNREQPDRYSIRFQWLRRPCKGFGFLTMDSEASKISLICRWPTMRFQHRGKHYSLSFKYARGKNPNEDNARKIMVRGLEPDAQFDELRTALNHFLEQNVDISRVEEGFLVPTPVPVTSPAEKTRLEDALKAKVVAILGHNNFELWLEQPRDANAVMQRGTLKVSDFEAACTIGESDINGFRVPGALYPLQLNTEFSTTVIIPRTMSHLTDEVKKLHQGQEEKFQGRVQINGRQTRGGSTILTIIGQNLLEIRDCQNAFKELIGGREVLLNSLPERVLFFSPEGRRLLREIGMSYGLQVFPVPMKSKISIYGIPSACDLAEGKITELLQNLPILDETNLKDRHWPRGFMRHLMLQFKSDLSDLVQKTGAKAVILNHRDHVMMLQGDEGAVERLKEILSTEAEAVSRKPYVPDPNAEECPICLTDLVGRKYRLELCGHAYHLECARGLLMNAIDSKTFPLVCCKESCDLPLELDDIESLCADDATTFHLRDSILAAYVGRNSDTVHYCSTPDCTMIYKVTAAAAEFCCPSCNGRWCSHCHRNCHLLLTCQEMKDGTGSSVEKWLREDPSNRKQCPKCKHGIEKDGGCMKVQCTQCNTELCWKCLKMFQSSTAAYDHLSRECANGLGIFQ